MTETRVKLAKPIRRLIASVARFLLIEGAMRASKTWGCLIKWRKRVEDYPGIALVMSRWKDEDLHNKLIPDYRKVCDLMGLPYGEWNAQEECFAFANGSRIYAINLKASEIAAAHSKARGFTIAGIYISQLEEVPKDVAREWMLRLSQPGFPHQFLADANPVHEGHWIAEMWPTDSSKLPEYEYLTASIWDNAHNLDASTIEAAEAMYPIGHPMRPAKLEGKRGANTEGDPVYEEYFKPSVHADDELEPWPHAPILVGWDFGAKHPAVSAAQFLPWGAFWSLGAILGDNVMLEWFAPYVLRTLSSWFPGQPLLHCGDPAGAARSNQGVSLNAKKVLGDIRLCPKCFSEHLEKRQHEYRCTVCTASVKPLAVDLKTLDDSNDLRVRYGCIQTLGGYMLRSTRRFVARSTSELYDAEDYVLKGGTHPVLKPTLADEEEPAFLIRPRGVIVGRKHGKPVEKHVSLIADALGGGYIWDDDFHGVGNLANIRRPLKDGFFEHPMNATEYVVHNYCPARPTDQVIAQSWVKEQRAQLKRAHEAMFPPPLPKDRDPYDAKRKPQGAMRRGGW